jgi:hypothetical protein
VVVERRSTFIAFDGLATGNEIGGSIWLIRHGHRPRARMMNMVSIGLGVQPIVKQLHRTATSCRQSSINGCSPKHGLSSNLAYVHYVSNHLLVFQMMRACYCHE